MTRETKIGLLVGLAFIIVIGILLSDHLTTATEPQQAYLPQVGGSVRSGVTIPGAGQQPQAGPAVTVAPVTPPQPVPTIQDLAPRPQPVQIVEVGPSGTAAQPPQQQQPLVQAPPVTLPPIASAPSAMPPVSIVPPPTQQQQPTAQPPAAAPQPTVVTTPVPAGNSDVLAQIARQYGEDVVTPGTGSNTNSSAATNPPPQPASAATPAAPDALLAGAKQYKAQDGDSLSRIASKCYGTNSKALRDAIVRANPSLQKNPELVIAGRTYVIPAVSAAAPPPPGPSAPAAPTPSAQPAPAQVAQLVNQPEYVYKVKDGDTLWNIAAEQLGNANAVAAIKDLNQDVLKGSDVVRPNMKLRLPAKPVAAAN